MKRKSNTRKNKNRNRTIRNPTEVTVCISDYQKYIQNNVQKNHMEGIIR